MKTILFWLASLTWGCIMTALGLLAALGLLITGHKPQKFLHALYFEVGKNWGGINLGPVFIVSKGSTLVTKYHEYGHGLQNLCWGPLFLFVIGLPSLFRCWYRSYLLKTGKKTYETLPLYDSIWFEGQATEWGSNAYMMSCNK